MNLAAIVVVSLVGVWALSGTAAAAARTITVNTTADSTGGPDCTLRDAITAANTDVASGGCRAGKRADTIVFSLSGQIELGSTLPAIASRIAIDGFGQDITMSGQGAVRVLEVSAAARATLAGLTIAEGRAAHAGGILNRGRLDVADSTLSRNVTEAEAEGNGGAIWNTAGGRLTVTDCVFTANGTHQTLKPPRGGGIFNDGKTRVSASTFIDNGADLGGAIFNAADGTLRVDRSAFSGNAAGSGGAISNRGDLRVKTSVFSGSSGFLGAGGAIANRDGGVATVARSTFSGNGANLGGGIGNTESTLTVKRSTFSHNRADSGGGIVSAFGALLVENSTFSGNTARDGGGVDVPFPSGTIRSSTFFGNTAEEEGGGGGIDAGGPLEVTNTIVAGSEGGNCSGLVTAASTNNLADDASCSPGFTQVGLTDLKLGPLADNGGPTQTIALGSGSVAIDAGDNAAAAGLFTDQRGAGFPRIVGGTIDVGAFEAQRPPEPLAVATLIFGVRA